MTLTGPAVADEVNNYGTSALYEAVWHERIAQAKRLLKNGDDPNFQTVSPQPKSIRGRTPLHAAVMTGNLEITKVLLEYGPNTNIHDELGQTPLLDAVLALSWNRINEPEKAQESQEIAQLLIETEANSTIPDALDDSPITLVAGYRVPGGKYTRDHSNGWLHQLMLYHIVDPSKLDDTMKWQGKGCYGYTVQREDKRLGNIAQKVYGEKDR